MNSLSFWVLILSSAGLATYATNSLCEQCARDRRKPSADRLSAVRAAYLFAVILTGYGILLFLGSDGRRFAVVRDLLHLGALASLFVAALAIKVMRGGGRRD